MIGFVLVFKAQLSGAKFYVSSKSVAGFPKIGRFPSNRCQISLKSVTCFRCIGGRFSHKRNRFIAQNRSHFSCSNKASLSLKRIFCYCFNLGQAHTVQKDKNTREKNCIPDFPAIFHLKLFSLLSFHTERQRRVRAQSHPSNQSPLP